VSAVNRYVERIWSIPPTVADAALAVAILGLNLIEVLFIRDDAPRFDPRGFRIFAVLCLPLMARRRYVWITPPISIRDWPVWPSNPNGITVLGSARISRGGMRP